jgi:hypothetical protein
MLASDADRWRLFLFPIRPFVKKDALEIGPSFPELSGQMLIKRQQDFDAMSEQFVAEALAKVSLGAAEFQDLVAKVLAEGFSGGR